VEAAQEAPEMYFLFKGKPHTSVRDFSRVNVSEPEAYQGSS